MFLNSKYNTTYDILVSGNNKLYIYSDFVAYVVMGLLINIKNTYKLRNIIFSNNIKFDAI